MSLYNEMSSVLEFVKPWKINSMINTMDSLPEIVKDEVRLLNYLHNCLDMEGVSTYRVHWVANVIRTHYGLEG